MTCVVDGDGRLAGIITDGDLRRHMARGPRHAGSHGPDIMTTGPVTIPAAMLAVEALKISRSAKSRR